MILQMQNKESFIDQYFSDEDLRGQFKRHFQTILEHIAKDKITASKNFKKELFKQIKNLSNFPFKYRESFYFEDENIRDL